MASLGAGQGDDSFLPCGKRGSCLCANARIAMHRECRRAAAREWGRWLSWSSQTESCLEKEFAHTGPGYFSSTLLLPDAVTLEVASCALH